MNEFWTAQLSKDGEKVDIVTASGGLVASVASGPVAERIVAAHNAAAYRAQQELERVTWLAEANHEAWLAATGQNGSGSAVQDATTGTRTRPAMRNSDLGRG